MFYLKYSIAPMMFSYFFSTMLSNEFYDYMMIFLTGEESMHTDC